MEAETSAIDLAALRTFIGRTQSATDVVSPRLVEAYCATLAPHLAATKNDEAPLAIHWCLAPPAALTASLRIDGHAAKGEFLPPVPLPRRMWAGGSIETLDVLRVGDQVTRVSKIADVSVKPGRSGTLCFVTVEHEYSTERGIAIRERQDLVYREALAVASVNAPVPAPAQPAPVAEVAATLTALPTSTDKAGVVISSALLFRYSALTFNGHRIHYDQPYATTVEGYAGLVVHGPLQASLLFNWVANLGSGVPRQFRYRGVSALTVDEGLRIAGSISQNYAQCHSMSQAGKVAMEATAEW